MKIPQNRLVAKSLYRLGGYLSRIKTYSRIYSLDFDGDDFTSSYIGRRWVGWDLGYKVGLDWAPRWDRKHWDHWALDHSHCGGTYCTTCKGRECGPDGDF